MNTEIIADIVTFWLSDSRDGPDRASARRDWWYRGGPVVDEEIRARFGRFPHRNAVFGRDSTTEERAYMAAGGESFGQGLQADNATC